MSIEEIIRKAWEYGILHESTLSEEYSIQNFLKDYKEKLKDF